MGFIKKRENFVCENCGAKVYGNGYTNHCPHCLWSKHVDKEVPGDRASNCHGLMKPVRIEQKNQQIVLIHQCLKCQKITRNKTSSDDNFEKILEISAKNSRS